MRIAAALAAIAFAGAAAAQPAIDADDLVGVWRGAEATAGVVIDSEVIFFADGRYQRMNMLGQLMNYVAGDYRLTGNLVHFEPKDYEPKVYLGVPQYPPPSDTWVIDAFDGRHLHGTVGQSEILFERSR
jgi:hypothetical protein